MKRNSVVKKIVSSVLVGSLSFWLVGCYTTRTISDLKSCKSEKITVQTKGGRTYLFTKWAADTSGNIRGKGAEVRPSEGVEYQAFAGTITSDSIATVQSEEGDGLKTMGLIVYGSILVLLIGCRFWASGFL